MKYMPMRNQSKFRKWLWNSILESLLWLNPRLCVTTGAVITLLLYRFRSTSLSTSPAEEAVLDAYQPLRIALIDSRNLQYDITVHALSEAIASLDNVEAAYYCEGGVHGEQDISWFRQDVYRLDAFASQSNSVNLHTADLVLVVSGLHGFDYIQRNLHQLLDNPRLDIIQMVFEEEEWPWRRGKSPLGQETLRLIADLHRNHRVSFFTLNTRSHSRLRSNLREVFRHFKVSSPLRTGIFTPVVPSTIGSYDNNDENKEVTNIAIPLPAHSRWSLKDIYKELDRQIDSMFLAERKGLYKITILGHTGISEAEKVPIPPASLQEVVAVKLNLSYEVFYRELAKADLALPSLTATHSKSNLYEMTTAITAAISVHIPVLITPHEAHTYHFLQEPALVEGHDGLEELASVVDLIQYHTLKRGTSKQWETYVQRVFAMNRKLLSDTTSIRL